MYFGEYLVSQKLITEDQLLDALIYQLEHTPSLLRVLRDEKLINVSEIFRLIIKQVYNNCSLVDVIKSEKVLSETQINALYTKQVENRKMLGAVLVELKILNATQVENSLLVFVKTKTEEKIETAPPVSISSAALESMKELGLSIEGLQTEKKEVVEKNIFVDNYLNIYNIKMNNKLAKLVSVLKEVTENKGDIANYINSLYGDLYILKGTAMSANLNLTLDLINELTKRVEEKLTASNEVINTWATQFLPLLEESFAFLWEIRNVVAEMGTEPAIDSKYQTIVKKLAIEIA